MQFKIENNINNEVTIVSIASDNEAFTVSGIVFPSGIPFNEYINFDVYFDSESSEEGKISIYSYDNSDEFLNQFDFYIDASPYSLLYIYNNDTLIESTTGIYDFGNIALDTGKTELINYYNSGVMDLTISGIVSSDSGVLYTSGVTLPLSITKKTSEYISTTFKPISTGVHTETFNIYNSSYNDIDYFYTVSGVVYNAFSDIQIYQDSVYITPTTGEINFEDTYINYSGILPLTIVNSGVSPLIISSVDSFNSGVISTSGITFPYQIEAETTDANINLIFNPDNNEYYSGVVTINNDSDNFPTYSFIVDGTGLPPDGRIILTQDGSGIAYNELFDFGVIE